jgi:hypothetical protein
VRNQAVVDVPFTPPENIYVYTINKSQVSKRRFYVHAFYNIFSFFQCYEYESASNTKIDFRTRSTSGNHIRTCQAGVNSQPSLLALTCNRQA